MSDIGRIPPTQVSWPTVPTQNIKGVGKEKRRQQDGQAEYEERDKRNNPPDDDQQHIDEYA